MDSIGWVQVVRVQMWDRLKCIERELECFGKRLGCAVRGWIGIGVRSLGLKGGAQLGVERGCSAWGLGARGVDAGCECGCQVVNGVKLWTE